MVRLPGARRAPIRSTCACRQTRSENNGAKVLKNEMNNGGKDSKEAHFPSHLHSTGPLQNGPSRGMRGCLRRGRLLCAEAKAVFVRSSDGAGDGSSPGPPHEI